MGKTVRLFIALSLSNAELNALKQPLNTLEQAVPSRGVRWVPRHNIHLTIKFLGDTPLSEVESIQQALTTATSDTSSFDVTIQGCGVFPKPKRPRIIWLGLNDHNREIEGLYNRVEHELSLIGIEKERRKFTPHLTVGRIKRHVRGSELADIGQAVMATCPKLSDEIVRWHCHRLELIESVLKPTGAEYTTRFQAAFI